MKRVVYFIILALLFPSRPLTAGKVEIEVLNVGQGNCILVKVHHKDKDPEHMIVDIGTSSYKKEFAYTKLVFSTQDAKPNISSPSLIRDFNPTIPVSTLKKVFPKKELDEVEWVKKGKKAAEGEDTFLQGLRKKIEKQLIKEEEKEGTKEEVKEKEIPSIYVKTVIITHPDTDHYGWLTKLFCEKTDHIPLRHQDTLLMV